MLFSKSQKVNYSAYRLFGARAISCFVHAFRGTNIFFLRSGVVKDMKIIRTGYSDGRMICSQVILSIEERSHAWQDTLVYYSIDWEAECRF